MMNNLSISVLLLTVTLVTGQAQPNKVLTPPVDTQTIPLSKADLGTFPYVKTLPNFTPTDSVTIEQNRTYFYDGKAYFTVDGQVSAQSLNVTDHTKKIPSEFQIIQTFDQLVATLGGKKIYEGKLPDELIKKVTTHDLVELDSHHQVAPSAYYGVVEYVIKTAQKEVWLQVQPYSIGSHFYTLLVVEKQSQLLSTNINKENELLKALEGKAKGVTYLEFASDKAELLTQSSDELLALVGVFQAHPEWKLGLEVHSAPVGQSAYILGLTQKRAVALKEALVRLGVKPSGVEATGLGDSKPLVSNETEEGRRINTRIEVFKR
ncbi:OmpA family protein [Spirosoma pollinicola]|uniref:OmpA-like domain-containing protein n=1 Tax=Spirosoma pollinicola TaxID=2057025 RepID=A0A2K8ZAN1_9BACT|nr:OmpA family protein [Spirosoma pollinicola]AUD06937.1 hypothetical protein CWM47_36920 [Spirosoma pollinicola]